MKKKSENQFIEKFRLLNSQATSEEIRWSCSDSSEYEDIQYDALHNITNNTSRKRKRVTKRKKNVRNASTLDITFVETVKKSPILASKSISNGSQKCLAMPCLTSPKNCLPCCVNDTNNTTKKSQESKNSSPIIHLKYETPNVSPKVKKKLFQMENCSVNSRKHDCINHKEDCLDRRKLNNNIYGQTKESNDISRNQFNDSFRSVTKDSNQYLTKVKKLSDIDKKLKECTERNEESSLQLTDSSSESNDTSRKKSCAQLVSKVKSYFDSYFSSQSSHHSISECETSTPMSSSKNSDDVEIVNSITQVREKTPSLMEHQSNKSIESDINAARTKKVKYKKGGIGYRLNELVKKQNANISLWQHERFMAANSNFVIPKEDFLAFRIINVEYKYNIYLLEVTNINDEHYLIIINSIHVNNNTSFESDNVLKVYEPFKIIDCNSDCKIILNVCKYECEKLKF